MANYEEVRERFVELGFCPGCPELGIFFSDMDQSPDGVIDGSWVDDGELAVTACHKNRKLIKDRQAIPAVSGKCPVMGGCSDITVESIVGPQEVTSNVQKELDRV